jgi:hypothetical protein
MYNCGAATDELPILLKPAILGNRSTIPRSQDAFIHRNFAGSWDYSLTNRNTWTTNYVLTLLYWQLHASSTPKPSPVKDNSCGLVKPEIMYEH